MFSNCLSRDLGGLFREWLVYKMKYGEAHLTDKIRIVLRTNSISLFEFWDAQPTGNRDKPLTARRFRVKPITCSKSLPTTLFPYFPSFPDF